MQVSDFCDTWNNNFPSCSTYGSVTCVLSIVFETTFCLQSSISRRNNCVYIQPVKPSKPIRSNEQIYNSINHIITSFMHFDNKRKHFKPQFFNYPEFPSDLRSYTHQSGSSLYSYSLAPQFVLKSVTTVRESSTYHQSS